MWTTLVFVGFLAMGVAQVDSLSKLTNCSNMFWGLRNQKSEEIQRSKNFFAAVNIFNTDKALRFNSYSRTAAENIHPRKALN